MTFDLWVANFNCPGQTVISGTMKGVEEGSKEALKRGAKRVIPLKVHGAFHSGLMKEAREKLKDKIEELDLRKSEIDLVMNVPGNFVRTDDLIRKYLVEQVTSPVRWEQSIKAMKDVDLFIEIGCGRTLSGLNKQMGLQAPTISINKVADLELLAGLMT
jgi:[acyl-carrier-protein] S-malonyltransferase